MGVRGPIRGGMGGPADAGRGDGRGDAQHTPAPQRSMSGGAAVEADTESHTDPRREAGDE